MRSMVEPAPVEGDKFGFGILFNKHILRHEQLSLSSFIDAIYFVSTTSTPTTPINAPDHLSAFQHDLGENATFTISFPIAFSRDTAEAMCAAVVTSLLKKHGKHSFNAQSSCLLGFCNADYGRLTRKCLVNAEKPIAMRDDLWMMLIDKVFEVITVKVLV